MYENSKLMALWAKSNSGKTKTIAILIDLLILNGGKSYTTKYLIATIDCALLILMIKLSELPRTVIHGHCSKKILKN